MTFEIMKYFSKYNRAIVMTGDGDFYWVLEYLLEKKKEVKLLSHADSTARELKKLFGEEFTDLGRIKSVLEYKMR